MTAVHKPVTLFENEEFIAVNKPSGLLSIPDRLGKEVSLKSILEKNIGKVFVVHRLDKDTSGIIVFAKSEQVHRSLNLLFENREVEKYYTALVHGRFAEDRGKITAPIAPHFSEKGKMMIHAKGKPSETDYQVVESFGNISLVQFQIHTGRTHQIRVHMQHIGHSIVGDALYGSEKPILLSDFKKNYNLAKKYDDEKPLLARMALHASHLNFTLDGNAVSMEAPLPKDMQATVNVLRKYR